MFRAPMREAKDRIHIEQLEVFGRVGVPDAERRKPQRLVLNITLWPRHGFGDLNDDVSRAVDYSKVAEETKKFVSEQSPKLIETLAANVADQLLKTFPIGKVIVELRKFVLPDTDYVSVTVTRSQDA